MGRHIFFWLDCTMKTMKGIMALLGRGQDNYLPDFLSHAMYSHFCTYLDFLEQALLCDCAVWVHDFKFSVSTRQQYEYLEHNSQISNHDSTRLL